MMGGNMDLTFSEIVVIPVRAWHNLTLETWPTKPLDHGPLTQKNVQPIKVVGNSP